MSTRGRVIFGVASQGVTSFTNFFVVIAIARTQSPDQLGSWTLAFAIVTLGTTLGRAALSTPIILTRVDDPARDISGGLGASIIGGLATGTATLLLGFTGLVSLDVAAALALSAVFALVQDFMRYTWIARGRPGRSLLLDVTWLTVQVGTSLAYLVSGGTSAVVLSLLWTAGAAAAVILGVVLDPYARLSSAATVAFYQKHNADSRRLFGESLANALAANLLPFVVTAVVGLAAAGAFRVAQTLFAPLTTLIAGLTPVVLRELAVRIDGGKPTRKIGRSYLLGLTAVNVLYSAVVLLLPSTVGVQIAGESWGLVTTLLIPLALFGVVRPFMTLAMLYLRAFRRFALLRTTGWLFIVPTLLWSAIMGASFGLAGVGWGQFFDSVIRTSFYALSAVRAAPNLPPAQSDKGDNDR
ncbi:hypothetical protein [Microbacterium schleiferi]|uniref:hypothetical protein n=1 Tax=Microbacterium schleiferi TaxID=69362 RepID=UPI00311ED578